jgi:hypothetical protein
VLYVNTEQQVYGVVNQIYQPYLKSMDTQDHEDMLGNLFQILFPEDTHLLSQVHYAGANVRMLSKILQYTFMNGSIIKSKIGSHLSPVTHSLINFPSINLDEIELSDEDLEECEGDDG